MHTQDLCVPDLAVCFPGDDQQVGDLAQMVERMLSMHEAQGSIPWFSTPFCFFQLGAPLQKKKRKELSEVGFEPTTFSLGGRRAIHCATRTRSNPLLDFFLFSCFPALPQVHPVPNLSCKNEATTTRFELARAEPIGFQNQLLNHSDTLSGHNSEGQNKKSCGRWGFRSPCLPIANRPLYRVS